LLQYIFRGFTKPLLSYVYRTGFWTYTEEANEREALDWNPQGKRRRGRPRHNVAKNCPQRGIRKREKLEWS